MASDDMQDTVEDYPDHKHQTDDPAHDLKNPKGVYSLILFDGLRDKFTIRFLLWIAALFHDPL